MIRQTNRVPVMSDEEIVGEVEDLDRLERGEEENGDNQEVSEEPLIREEAQVPTHLRGERVVSIRNAGLVARF